MSEFYFIVDTNQYAGSFERQMCAYMTGHVGECGVGEKEARIYLKQYKLVKGVMEKPDDHGCYRPVRICSTPNIWNNGYGFHYKEGEEALALEAYKNSKKEWNEQQIKLVESYRDKDIPSWDTKKIEEAVQRYQEEIRKGEQETTVPKYKAYQSVLIYFEAFPTEEMIDFLKARAYDFATYKKKDLHITGFRLAEKA